MMLINLLLECTVVESCTGAPGPDHAEVLIWQVPTTYRSMVPDNRCRLEFSACCSHGSVIGTNTKPPADVYAQSCVHRGCRANRAHVVGTAGLT
jgi:hypothetical protein